MNKYQQLWKSLENQEYRRAFTNDIGTGLAFQIRLLREQNEWSQEELAQKITKRQETISQWENPDYGRYTLNTLKELATAFDVALIVKFAPFSELVDWTGTLTPQRLAPPSFDKERRAVTMQPLLAQARSTVEPELAETVAKTTYKMPLLPPSSHAGILYNEDVATRGAGKRKELEFAHAA
ncbi:MAG: helix-turn-helix transcriptional regulator [Chloroflexi bacterium]|nr:helix-turn-helix transcriptional regulator [Chloroflexota bacterium]